MFVATFYSYKGGVGRSLALANVAAELARRGKSVLVADFDLEAPGVTSFEFGAEGPQLSPCPGVVDFVLDWLQEGVSPDVRKYISECAPPNENGGRIWVMPAGTMDHQYGSRLSKIDFGSLYEEHDGFLLFEDLKEQWRTSVGADYVLIDSRTGHTDVGGICTRQLPDLVVSVFWPNAQNLSGLELMSAEILEQEKESNRKIARLFVPSNLPILDDEDGILRELLERFRRTLRYLPSQEIRIFNYPSIDLLQQKIFALHRPNSRLAREYRALADAVQMHNMVDEGGVRLFLERVTGQGRRNPPRSPATSSPANFSEEEQKKIEEIEKKDWQDQEILRMLAGIRAREGETSIAIKLTEKLIARRQDSLADHLRMADWAMSAGMTIDVQTTVNRLLDDPEASQRHIIAAVNLFVKGGASEIDRLDLDLVHRPAVKRLNTQQAARICSALSEDAAKTRLAAEIVRAALLDTSRRGENFHDDDVSNPLALALIGAGFFGDAEDLLRKAKVRDASDELRRTFNLAMAIWGRTGEPPREQFTEVVRLHEARGAITDGGQANYNQCLSLALGVLGELDRAHEFLGAAQTEIYEQGRSFSCWSYLVRRTSDFVAELDEMRSWLASGSPAPCVVAGRGSV